MATKRPAEQDPGCVQSHIVFSRRAGDRDLGVRRHTTLPIHSGSALTCTSHNVVGLPIFSCRTYYLV
jgi:hypothetical protein